MIDIDINYEEDDNLLNVIQKYKKEMRRLSYPEYDDINWVHIFDDIRRYVSLRNDEGDYQPNIIPDVSKMDIIRFKNWAQDMEDAFESKYPYIERKCKECGESFLLYKSEIDFYKKNNLSIPKRCKNCRQKRKAEAITA